jgi:hypothetical protein
MKKIYFFYILFLVPFALIAQGLEVDAKFKGEWVFNQATVHEGAIVTINSQEEFSKDVRFLEVPIEICFFEAFDGLIATAYKRQFVVPVMNEKQQLEFLEIVRDHAQPDAEPEYIVSGTVFTHLWRSTTGISMQYDYTYRNEQNQEVTGFVQVFYKSK